MPNPEREAARRQIEGLFRTRMDRDMTEAARQRCQRHDLRAMNGQAAEDCCMGADAAVSELIWTAFLPRWDGVVYEYDGTHGEATRFLACKTLALTEYAQSGGRVTPRVRDAAAHAGRELAALWRVWAGYMATTSDELAPAVDEFEVEV